MVFPKIGISHKNWDFIVSSSTIDIFYQIYTFTKIGAKFTFFTKIATKFTFLRKFGSYFGKKCKFGTYFGKKCNLVKNVNGR